MHDLRRAAYVLLALLLAISLIYRVRDTADRFDELRHGDTIARLPFDFDLPQMAVGSLMPEADAAGLQEGEQVVGVSGRPLRGINDLLVPLRSARAGDRLDVEIVAPAAAGAPRRQATVILRPMRSSGIALRDWVSFAIIAVAMPYLCLALGLWVAAVRPRDPHAWLLLLLLLSLSEFAGGPWRTLYGRDDAFQPIAVIYQTVLANLWPTAMMLFGIYLAGRLPIDRRAPWAKWVVMAPILFRVIGANTVLGVASLNHLSVASQVDLRFGWTRTPVAVLQLTAVLVFFGAMVYKTRTAVSPDARRRLLMLDAGAAVSVIPVVTFVVLSFFDLVQFDEWMRLPLLGALFVFPVTIAYVILVERAMDVRVVVRLGLQYFLARGSVRIVQAGLTLVIVIGIAALSVTLRPLPRVVLITLAFGAVLWIRAYADSLRRWVDRRFFREAYDAEQMLSDLADKVRTIVERGPLVQTVADSISETLHVPRIAVLINSGGELQPAYAVGHSHVPSVSVPAGGWTGAAQQDLQKTLDAELVLPLSSNHQLLGVLGLGPKQSEEPYSSSDIRLLGAVASQTGLALHNSQLTSEIAAATVRREKARRELEIAREVQERLFPQDYPPVHGLDYAGACRSALSIGGDYYDFILLSATELGIAIGDVSGKGIPAALLMATLRAYLRGQAIHHQADLAGMMVNLNRLVFESSTSNKYATFFYAEYDSSSRVMNYVNAGHNAPMIFREGAGGRTVIRLDTGGPVIGLMEDCFYQQGQVTLEPGDVVVAFTDGISEAMDAADEEWGEDRLQEAVWPSRTIPASDLIESIMRSADAFVAGAPQHDDMTTVILRVLS